MIATGLAGGATGTRIVEALNDEAILNSFVRVREESRTNTAVLDPTTGLHTEINERGPAVSPQELELFREKLLYLAKGASMCVFAGSLPRGVEPDMYAELIREVRKLGVTTVLDTDGEPLRLAIRAEPDVVSPNELEAEELVGQEFNDVEDRAQAVIEMTRLGAGEAIMTVARRLLRLCARGRRPTLYRVTIEEQEARSGSARATRSWPATSPRATGPAAGRMPALRGRVRRRVDPALRRRDARPAEVDRLLSEVERPSGSSSAPRSADCWAGGFASRCSIAGATVPLLAQRGDARLTSRPRLGCADGSRDRSRKEGPEGLRVRRDRDRAVAPDARPRRRRHLLDARPVPVRAAAAGGRARRRRLAGDGRA